MYKPLIKILLSPRLVTGLALIWTSIYVAGQPPLPNHLISVAAIGQMNFGTFCLYGGGSGTITLDAYGSRTTTGSVAALNIGDTPTPAIFDIKLCQGRNIRLTYPSSITLTSGSGGTLTLSLNPDRGNYFQIVSDCDFVTRLRIGGTLTTSGSAQSPPGIYTGTIYITFNQE